jgi:hypothetical protein
VVARARLLTSVCEYDVARMKMVPGLRDDLLFADPDRAIDEQPYLDGQETLIQLQVETRIAPPLRAVQRAEQAL